MQKLCVLLVLLCMGPFILMIGSMTSCESPVELPESPIEGEPGVTGGEGDEEGESSEEGDTGGEDDDSGEEGEEGDEGENGGETDNGGENPHVHTAGDWIITIAPSCEEDGLQELRCVEDGAVMETEPIPAIGHDWNEEWETVSLQSESMDGTEAVTCRNDPAHIRESRVFAYATGTDGLVFSLSGGTYKVTSASGNAASGTVYVPAFWRPQSVTDFDSYKPVAVIGSYVFANKETITGIVIPPSVTSIEQYAFYYCTDVDEIAIPATLTTIGKFAFSGWGSAGPQTIVLPFASLEEAVSSWGTDWLNGNNALLVAGKEGEGQGG
jgi:hypothetical protein